MLVLVFRPLYCFSLLSFSINFPVILFCYFFLLFCIPLVYLWYSLIPSRVLSNHPLLFPSSPPISFRHLHPSLQLCPLPETPSPPENRPLLRNLRPIRKFRPIQRPQSPTVQCSAISRRVYVPPPKKTYPAKLLQFSQLRKTSTNKIYHFQKYRSFFLCISDFFSNFAPQ